MALNKFIGMGRFVRDPEMKRVPSGSPVTTFCIAVERDYKDKATGKRESDFINCVAWNKTAEYVAKYFDKGKMAVVDGRIQVRNWTDNDGVKHYTTEVVVDTIYFGESKKAQEAALIGAYGEGPAMQPQEAEWTEEQNVEEGDLPF